MRDVEIIKTFEGTVVIELHGEHDRLTCEQLRELLASEIASNEVVVVDVNDAKFIDSSFLHNLQAAARLAAQRGSRFIVQMAGGSFVSKVIGLSGVLHDIEWVDSLDRALRSLARPPRVAEGVPA